MPKIFPYHNILDQPLLEEKLSRYFTQDRGLELKLYRKILETLEPQISRKARCHRRCRVLAPKTILALGACLGRVPLIGISTKFEPVSEALSIVFAACNFISMANFLILSSNKQIDHASLSWDLIEKTRLSRCDFVKKVTLLTLSALNALAAISAYALLSWDYNKQQPYMLCLNATDLILPTCLLYMLFCKALEELKKNATLKTLSSIKQDILERIDQKLALCLEQKDTMLVDMFFDISRSVDTDTKMTYIMHGILSRHPQHQSEDDKIYKKVGRMFKGMFSSALLLSQTSQTAYLSYKALQRFKAPEAVCISACVYIALCNIGLLYKVLFKSMDKCLDEAWHFFCLSPQKTSLLAATNPLISRINLIASFALGLCSFVVAMQISKDYLPQNLLWPSTILYGLGLSLLGSMSLKSTLDDVTLSAIKKTSSQPINPHLEIYEKLLAIKKLFQAIDNKDLALFLLRTYSQSAIGLLCVKHKIAKLELEMLLSQYDFVDIAL